MICDMHIHSEVSHDGRESVDDIAKSCIEKRISVFAITDHCDIQEIGQTDVFGLACKSVENAIKAKEKYKDKVKVLVGIEIGEAILNLDYTNRLLNFFDFDVVIGSVHGIRYKGNDGSYSQIDFSTFTDKMLNDYMSLYFDELLETLQSIKFDIMAHLTCPLRYINGKYSRGVDSRNYEKQITKILDYIIKNQIAMEINTSGVNDDFTGLMPDLWIIEKYKKMGGNLITLGSDAHIKERVANGFDKVIPILKDMGFDTLCYFEKRQVSHYQP